MRTLKQFRFVLWLILVFSAVYFWQGCKNPNPPFNAGSRPNPIINFAVSKGAGFSVTPDTIPQATSVLIEVTGPLGKPSTSFTGQPGVPTVINLDTTFHRPLRLKFTYKSAANETVAEDQLLIDDVKYRGTVMPDMDVVVGITNFSTCPGAPNPVTVTTNTANTESHFSWSPGDAFEVQLGYGGTIYKFRINPALAAGTNIGGTATIYEQTSHSCLSHITTQAVSSIEMAITSISNNCTVRAYNDGTTRTVTIQYPSGTSISVHK